MLRLEPLRQKNSNLWLMTYCPYIFLDLVSINSYCLLDVCENIQQAFQNDGQYFMPYKRWHHSHWLMAHIGVAASRPLTPTVQQPFNICCWRPFYLLREFASVIIAAVYVRPQVNARLELEQLHDTINHQLKTHLDSIVIVAGDFCPKSIKM